MQKDYKKKLLNSLLNDTDSWEIKSQYNKFEDKMNCSFVSKEYGDSEIGAKISFRVDDVSYGTCIFIDRYSVIRLNVYPFTKLSRAIKKMKKHMEYKLEHPDAKEESNVLPGGDKLEYKADKIIRFVQRDPKEDI